MVSSPHNSPRNKRSLIWIPGLGMQRNVPAQKAVGSPRGPALLLFVNYLGGSILLEQPERTKTPIRVGKVPLSEAQNPYTVCWTELSRTIPSPPPQHFISVHEAFKT